MNIKHRNDSNSTQYEISINYPPNPRPRFGVKNVDIQDDPTYAVQIALLFTAIEQDYGTGKDLSEANWTTLNRLSQRYKKFIPRLVEYGCIRLPEEKEEEKPLTLGEAWDRYLAFKLATNWDDKTHRLWINRGKRSLIKKLSRDRLIETITDEDVVFTFEARRTLNAFSTLKKDFDSFKQMLRYWSKKRKFAFCLDEITLSEKYDKKGNSVERKDRKRHTEYVSEEQFLEALQYVSGAEKKALFAYYRFMGARRADPTGDYWSDIEWKNDQPVKIRRYCIKRKRKLKVICPIPPQLQTLIKRLHDEVVREEGKAEGLIFPYLQTCDGSSVYNYYFDAIKNHVAVWPSLFRSLRASRSRDIRRNIPNGRFFESAWIGHSEDIADEHYDDVLESDLEAIYDPTRLRLATDEDDVEAA